MAARKSAKTNRAPAKAKQRKKKTKSVHTLHIVSDGTGFLAGHMITAILSQFPDVEFKSNYHVLQDSLKKLEVTVESFGSRKTLVLHALVDPEAKCFVQNECVKRKIPHYDLTGSLVQFVSDHIRVAPANEFARLHQVNTGYFQRVEALEFTSQHDDGLGIETIHEADIVLVGVSRVSKSPTAMFLAAQGFKTANVSITPVAGFPKELNKVKKRVVALTMQPKRLQEIRTARLANWNMESMSYDNLRDVIIEVQTVNVEFRKRRYPIVDITQMTIELTAATVLDLLGLRHSSD
jgi:regulator of PEP synthase PpsR (kinase-PPPase family)